MATTAVATTILGRLEAAPNPFESVLFATMSCSDIFNSLRLFLYDTSALSNLSLYGKNSSSMLYTFKLQSLIDNASLLGFLSRSFSVKI
jgi:hypothetical protein